MSLVYSLISFGLRQAFGEPAEAVFHAVQQRLMDQSQALPKALASANDRAWQALGVALAGDGFLDQVGVLFASGTDRAIREQVRVFLDGGGVSFQGTPAAFRQACLVQRR